MVSIKTICIYASSSDTIHDAYHNAAHELGKALSRRNFNIIFGGGRIGLMGTVARACQSGKGKIIAVIPERLHKMNVVYEEADEIIITQDLRERKAIMENRSDAFIALPGGFGTLEELLEVITLKQLKFHQKPIILFNTRHFFEPLLQVFEAIYSEKFAHPDFKDLYYCTEYVDSVMAYLDHYHPAPIPDKLISSRPRKYMP